MRHALRSALRFVIIAAASAVFCLAAAGAIAINAILLIADPVMYAVVLAAVVVVGLGGAWAICWAFGITGETQ